MGNITLEGQLNDLKRKVDFNTYDISVKEIINMVSEGLIDIAPEYQRQFRWDIERQSALIESIFLGIPVPSTYMATNLDGSWELIDGVQRISSIVRFAGSLEDLVQINQQSNLKITGLEKLTQLNGYTFNELPKNIQLQFLLKPLKVTTLSDKSDVEVRFDLFERLNTGGVKLTDQEIRSCIFRGAFNDFILSLSENEDFKNVVRLSKNKESDGTRSELVLRFFAYLDGYKDFEHSVVDFLNSYMKSATKNFDYRNKEEIFIKVFNELSKALPNGISRRFKTTPINLYEAVSVGAALALLETGELKIDRIEEWIKSDELKKTTSGASNDKVKVVKRIEFCKEKFKGK
ncbi:hypothetical protein CJ195_22445 [Bacillus sp. UMB0899]|nr:hypothetical protein CJ195_22445 [Bacillus sp. UMB0899]